MALQQNFSVSQSQSGSTLYPSDETGEYSIDNTTGYGTPNTNREDIAIILIANRKPLSGDVELTPDSYDPETVQQWTITGQTTDGHIQLDFYSIDIKTGAETPTLNDFVYDATADELQRWSGSAWVAAENSELEDNDVTHITVDYPLITQMWLAFNNLNKLYISGCKTMNRNDLKAAISDTSAMINGTIALFAEGSFAQAQEGIEKYQSRVETLIALSQ